MPQPSPVTRFRLSPAAFVCGLLGLALIPVVVILTDDGRPGWDQLPQHINTAGIGVVAAIVFAVISFASGLRVVRQRKIMLLWMIPAGLVIATTLVTSGHFPEYRQLLLSVVISSTVFFEIVGPPFMLLRDRRIVREPYGPSRLQGAPTVSSICVKPD